MTTTSPAVARETAIAKLAAEARVHAEMDFWNDDEAGGWEKGYRDALTRMWPVLEAARGHLDGTYDGNLGHCIDGWHGDGVDCPLALAVKDFDA